MKPKILIIEDDQLMAGLLSEKMGKAEFDVSLAMDGEAGFKELEKQLPDIILLDLILPGMGGFEILEKLKKDERTKDIPVIILSNLGSRDEVQRGLSLGAEAYLIKANILIDEVIVKVRGILEKKKVA